MCAGAIMADGTVGQSGLASDRPVLDASDLHRDGAIAARRVDLMLLVAEANLLRSHAETLLIHAHCELFDLAVEEDDLDLVRLAAAEGALDNAAPGESARADYLRREAQLDAEGGAA